MNTEQFDSHINQFSFVYQKENNYVDGTDLSIITSYKLNKLAKNKIELELFIDKCLNSNVIDENKDIELVNMNPSKHNFNSTRTIKSMLTNLIKEEKKIDSMIDFKLKLSYNTSIKKIIDNKINLLKNQCLNGTHMPNYIYTFKKEINELNEIKQNYNFYTDEYNCDYLSFNFSSIDLDFKSEIEEFKFYKDVKMYYIKILSNIIIDKEKQSRSSDIIDLELKADYNENLKKIIKNEIDRIDAEINMLIDDYLK